MYRIELKARHEHNKNKIRMLTVRVAQVPVCEWFELFYNCICVHVHLPVPSRKHSFFPLTFFPTNRSIQKQPQLQLYVCIYFLRHMVMYVTNISPSFFFLFSISFGFAWTTSLKNKAIIRTGSFAGCSYGEKNLICFLARIMHLLNASFE